MAAKVETLRINTHSTPRGRGFATKIAAATKAWAQRGQLGRSADMEMRAYTGAR